MFGSLGEKPHGSKEGEIKSAEAGQGRLHRDGIEYIVENEGGWRDERWFLRARRSEGEESVAMLSLIVLDARGVRNPGVPFHICVVINSNCTAHFKSKGEILNYFIINK